MTRTDMLKLITVIDLNGNGYGPPEPGSHHYEERCAEWHKRVARAAGRATETLDAIEAALAVEVQQ